MDHETLLRVGMTSDPMAPPPLPGEVAVKDRPAAWWSWPLILLSVLFIGWSVNLFSPAVAEEIESTGDSVNAADLALFKLQGQVIIAAAPLSPADAKDSLEELRAYATNDALVLALVLVESFLDFEDLDPAETLKKVPEDAYPESRALVEKAIKEGLAEEERTSLGKHFGWFAELAPGPKGEAPPRAETIRLRAMVFLGVGSFLFLGVLAGVLVGAILLILQFQNSREGKSRGRFEPHSVPRGIMLECFALYLGIMAFGDLGGQWIHIGISYASYLLAVIVPFLWPMFRGVDGKLFRRSIGWHLGEGFWREVGAGAVGYLKVMAFASVGVLLTLTLSFLVGAFSGSGDPSGGSSAPAGPQAHPVVGWIYLGGWRERLLCLLLAAVFAPIFEELFFRGALHRWLRGKFPFFVSALLTGAIFAALHPQGWLGIPALAAIGIGFSLLRESRDSLIAPMIAHSINNGILVILLCLAL